MVTKITHLIILDNRNMAVHMRAWKLRTKRWNINSNPCSQYEQVWWRCLRPCWLMAVLLQLTPRKVFGGFVFPHYCLFPSQTSRQSSHNFEGCVVHVTSACMLPFPLRNGLHPMVQLQSNKSRTKNNAKGRRGLQAFLWFLGSRGRVCRPAFTRRFPWLSVTSRMLIFIHGASEVWSQGPTATC